jgi:hypothetical protein
VREKSPERTASELLGSKRFRHPALVAQTRPWRLVILISSLKWSEAKTPSLLALTFMIAHEPALQSVNQLLWSIRMQK